MATLLTVGAILLGPPIAACYGKPGGTAACLRDKLESADILPLGGASVPEDLNGGASSSLPPEQADDQVAPEPFLPPSPGLLSTTAIAPGPIATASTQLAPEPGTTTASGRAGGVALATSLELTLRGGLRATGSQLSPVAPNSGSLLLSPPPGVATLSGAARGAPISMSLELAAPVGELAAGYETAELVPRMGSLRPSGVIGQLVADSTPVPASSVAVDLWQPGTLGTWGRGGAHGIGAEAERILEGSEGRIALESVSYSAAPIGLADLTYRADPLAELSTGSIGGTGSLAVSPPGIGTAALSPAPVNAPPPPVIAPPVVESLPVVIDETRFPSVTLLPPPNSGENAAIISLSLGG